MKVDLVLPKTPAARAKMIRNHVFRERRTNAYWRALSNLALYYSLGFRKFDVFDPTSGAVRPVFFDDKEGGLEYWSNTLLFEIQEIVGHMSSLDMGPSVRHTGTSLSAIRERSITQVLLDSTTDRDRVSDVQKAWSWLSAMYGMAGISTHIDDSTSVGLAVDLEVVHPEEIIPFPSTANNHFSSSGMIRIRTVPLDWLKKVYGGSKVAAGIRSQRMYRATIQYGEPVTSAPSGFPEGTASYVNPTIAAPEQFPSTETAMEVAEIAELWVIGPSGTVTEYCVVSGEYEFEYVDYRGVTIYPTLNIGRFYENGSWYGTSHFFMRYGSHRAAERMLTRLFKNIRQQDKYQLLVLPQGEYNEDLAFTDYGEALRFLKVRPDVYSESFRPFSVPVPNAGNLPIQAVQAAAAEGDRVNPVPDLLRNKGRVDSGPGLAALEESSRKAITNPEQSMIRVFSSSWRSAAQQLSGALVERPQPLPVKRLTLDMLGIIVSDDDTVSFDENPIPNIRLMEFTVNEENPRSLEVRKQEAQASLQMGLMTPDEYKLFLIREGIDVAMWLEPFRSIWHREVRNLLTLYGDGRTPGRFVTTADTTRPDIQLMILESVLYSDALRRASPQVQNEFAAYKQYLEAAMGFALPPGVPSFEELLASEAPTAGAAPPQLGAGAPSIPSVQGA